MANKIGSKKKTCEKYRNSGHKEENKVLKQKRHEKRMARFAKRKEEGKSYVYRTGHAQEKIKDNRNCNNYNPILGTWGANSGSERAKHTEVSMWKSIMAKLDYELNKKEAAEKAEMMARELRKKGK